ncbi:MAG: AAA family ATPase [Pseudomonadota bacterium]
MSPIRDWLEALGLSRYAETFEENEIDLDLLGELDHDALKELGVTVLGHRLKILKAAAGPAPAGETPAAPAPAPAAAEVEAERRQLTIMFCDLVGSTAISNQLDPEDYRDLMQLYQETAAGIVMQFGGHVAQYLGDGLMVFFGYPVAQEDAAERAVRAGLQVIRAVSTLTNKPGLALKVRVGVATVLVVVGDLVGQSVTQDAAVSGETPNLAARLQSVAEPNQMVIGEVTRRLLGGLFHFEAIEGLQLKGFEGAQRAFRVLGEEEHLARFEARASGPMVPLIGRDAERDRIAEAWAAARAGQGGVLLLSGEPGIGKSRLVREAVEIARADGGVVNRYQCSPFFTNSILYPVLHQLELAAHFAPGDDGAAKRAKLAALLRPGPEEAEDETLIAAALSLPLDGLPALNLSPALQKARTLEAIIRLTLRATEDAPLLFVFEDAHWVDPTTLDLLDLLIARLPERRAMLLMTFRPEFTPRWEEGPGLRHIALERLGPEASAALIAELAADMAPEVRAGLVARADGVPLFVEELTKTVLESEGGGTGDIPESLKDSLMARLDRLKSAKEVAQIASVIGREFTLPLLAAVTGRTEAQLRGQIEALAAADLVHPSPGLGAWHFKHALLQDAAYDSILRRRRQALHRRIAERIVEAYPERAQTQPEFVAHHFTASGLPERAAPHWLAAGQRAWGRAAATEALAHLDAGLTASEAIEEAGARDVMELKLQSTRGVVHFAATGYASPQAKDAFERALDLCDAVGDIDLRIGVYYGIGAFETMKGDITAGHAAFRLLASTTAMAEAPRYDVYTQSMLAWSHYNRGDFAEAVTHARQVNALYEAGAWTTDGARLSAADPRVISECFHAAALWALGRPDAARAVSDGVLAYARELGDPYSLVYALTNSAIRVPELNGDLDAVLALTEEGIAMANELGYGFLGAFASFWRARALSARGETAAAVEMSGRAVAGCEKAGVRYHGSLFRAHHAALLFADGQPEAARAALPAAADGIHASGELAILPEFHLTRGRVLAALGEDPEPDWQEALAEAHTREAAGWELRAALALAELWEGQGERDEGVRLIEPLIEATTEGAGTPDIDAARAFLGRAGVTAATV